MEVSSKVSYYRTFSFHDIWQKVKLNIFLQILDILGFVLLMELILMREVTLVSINCDLILLANSFPSPIAILQSLHKIPLEITNRHLMTV